MPDTKLSALAAASDITSADFYGAQGGTSKKFASTLFAGIGVANVFTAAQTITPASANVTPLTINQSLTGAAANAALSIAPTWNTSGVALGLDLTVTDTASGAGSLPLRVRGGAAGTTTLFSIDKSGNMVNNGIWNRIPGGTYTASWDNSGISITVPAANTARLLLSQTGIAGISWSNVPSSGISSFSGTGTHQFTNGTNPVNVRVYGTFTDASNGDWLNLTKTAGGAATISTNANGTGTAGNVNITAGASTWQFQSGGNFISNSNVFVPAISLFGISTRLQLLSPSDGVAQVTNSAGTDFSRLQFGGTTSAFPAIKRVGSRLEARLADDSAAAEFICAKVATTWIADVGLTNYLSFTSNVVTADTNIQIRTCAGNTNRAPFRIVSGVAPTTPSDGDIWFDGTDLKMRVGGVTKTFTLV